MKNAQISNEQISMMRHALAWPKCYRNHYCAASIDIDEWDDLVDKGFAIRKDLDWTCGPIYHVTQKGKDLLKEATDV